MSTETEPENFDANSHRLFCDTCCVYDDDLDGNIAVGVAGPLEVVTHLRVVADVVDSSQGTATQEPERMLQVVQFMTLAEAAMADLPAVDTEQPLTPPGGPLRVTDLDTGALSLKADIERRSEYVR